MTVSCSRIAIVVGCNLYYRTKLTAYRHVTGIILYTLRSVNDSACINSVF